MPESSSDNPKNVLITGATGFIGSRLVYALRKQGAKLTFLSRRELNLSYGKTILCDLEHQPIPKEWLDGIDTIYHLAGYAHDLSDPDTVKERYEALNIQATKSLAQAAVDASVRKFVFVSSVKAGGITSTGLNMHEESQAQPDGIYGETKYQAERSLLELHTKTPLDVIILRPSLVYGPRVKGNLNLMLNGIAQGWFPPIPKTGNQRSMVHVDDVVDALIYLSSHRDVSGEVFILTDGQSYSTHDIYSELRLALGKSKPRWAIPKIGFDLLSQLSPQIRFKLQKLFGNESYSSAKLEKTGFRPTKTLRNINETRY